MDGFGKVLMSVGAVMFIVGGAIFLASRLGWLPLGRLPGDIVVRRNGVSLYFPIVTCVVMSVLGSLILWLLGAARR
jgi:hypothetical protein